MSWVVARLAEPSTWVGFGMIVNAIAGSGAQLFGNIASKNYVGAIEIVAGLLGVVLKEGKESVG